MKNKNQNQKQKQQEETRYYVYPDAENVNQAIAEALATGKFGSFSAETQQVEYRKGKFPAFNIPREMAIYLAKGEFRNSCHFLTRQGEGDYRKWSLRKKKNVIKNKVTEVIISKLNKKDNDRQRKNSG